MLIDLPVRSSQTNWVVFADDRNAIDPVDEAEMAPKPTRNACTSTFGATATRSPSTEVKSRVSLRAQFPVRDHDVEPVVAVFQPKKIVESLFIELIGTS